MLKLGAVISKPVLIKWGARYRGFARLRFTENSRGSGRWKPLKAATIRRRRQGGGSGSVASILWDLGTLIGALDFKYVRAPGQLQKYLRSGGEYSGVRVGFGGPGKMKVRGKKGKIKTSSTTIAMVAAAHQVGNAARGLPARPIIVPPDTKTLNGMADDVEVQWRRDMRGS